MGDRKADRWVIERLTDGWYTAWSIGRYKGWPMGHIKADQWEIQRLTDGRSKASIDGSSISWSWFVTFPINPTHQLLSHDLTPSGSGGRQIQCHSSTLPWVARGSGGTRQADPVSLQHLTLGGSGQRWYQAGRSSVTPAPYPGCLGAAVAPGRQIQCHSSTLPWVAGGSGGTRQADPVSLQHLTLGGSGQRWHQAGRSSVTPAPYPEWLGAAVAPGRQIQCHSSTLPWVARGSGGTRQADPVSLQHLTLGGSGQRWHQAGRSSVTPAPYPGWLGAAVVPGRQIQCHSSTLPWVARGSGGTRQADPVSLQHLTLGGSGQRWYQAGRSSVTKDFRPTQLDLRLEMPSVLPIIFPCIFLFFHSAFIWWILASRQLI